MLEEPPPKQERAPFCTRESCQRVLYVCNGCRLRYWRPIPFVMCDSCAAGTTRIPPSDRDIRHSVPNEDGCPKGGCLPYGAGVAREEARVKEFEAILNQYPDEKFEEDVKRVQDELKRLTEQGK